MAKSQNPSRGKGATKAAPRAGKTSPADKPLPVYVVHGPDDSLRSRELQLLLKELHTGAADVTEFSGPAADLADVLDELRTLPFLADRRIVVVRDADEFVSKHRKVLERYCSAPSETGVLVLDCKRWGANTNLAKIVQKIGRAISSQPPSRRELAGWLIRYAATQDKRLEPAAAQLTLDLLGDEEPAILLAEIEKLSTYVGRRSTIGIKDVEALVSPLRSETVFAVTDAMADGDPATALALWEQVLATDRQAAFRAVGGLAWGIRRLLKARRLLEAGRSVAQAAEAARIRGAPPVVARRIKAFSSKELALQLAWLSRIDLSCKTGGDIRTEVQRFILAVCNGHGRPDDYVQASMEAAE